MTGQSPDTTARDFPTVAAIRAHHHAHRFSRRHGHEAERIPAVARGALFKEGSKHTRVYYRGRQSTLPRHPAHDIGEALRKAIIRQLGL